MRTVTSPEVNTLHQSKDASRLPEVQVHPHLVPQTESNTQTYYRNTHTQKKLNS